jgi:two-component sensor histidine kinase
MKKKLLLFIFFGISGFAKGQSSGTIDSLIKSFSTINDTAKTNVFFEIGNAYYLKGMNDSALHYFSISSEKAAKYKDAQQVCNINLIMAKCYMHIQKYDDALELLFKSINIAEKKSLNNITANAKYLISIVYNFQLRYKDALQFSLQAEKEFNKLNDTAGLLSLYPQLITIYGKNGDTSTALAFFRKGLNMFDSYEKSNRISAIEKQHLPLRRMALIFNAAVIMEQNADLLMALNEVKELENKIKTGDNDYEKFEVNTLIGIINLRLKRYRDAQFYAEEAVKLIRPESGNYDQLADVYEIIFTASDSIGDYKKAYGALLLYKSFKDSMYKIKSLEAIHSVEVKYESKKKEEQINTLNREKKSQKILVIISIAGIFFVLGLLAFALRAKKLQKELLLKETENQKSDLEKKMYELEQTALRAQMNPHFIFNCLNSVQRFIIGNDAEGANEYLSTFANLIRQTLENSGKKMITLKDELRYLETYIRMEQLRGNNKFEYHINISADVDQSETFIPNMIVQPFVENSIQHGMIQNNSSKGHIKLNISQSNKLNVIIDDNGPGIKYNNMVHSDETAHHSMGGAITEKRIAMYNSVHEDKIEMEILDKSDIGTGETGTRVILNFPFNN